MDTHPSDANSPSSGTPADPAGPTNPVGTPPQPTPSAPNPPTQSAPSTPPASSPTPSTPASPSPPAQAPSPTQPTPPAQTPPPSEKGTKGEKGEKDKVVRKVSITNRFTEEYAKLVKSAGPTPTSEVLKRLHESRLSLNDLSEVLGARPGVQGPAEEEKVVWEAERKQLSFRVVDLQKCLSVYPAGKKFVAETRNSKPEVTASNMRNQMTPGVLRHNGPVYQAMLRALDEFDKVDREYASLRTQLESINEAVAYHTRKLTLRLQGVRLAIKLDGTDRSLAALKPNTPSRKPRRKAKASIKK